MDELTILTRQEPGISELDNFDEIKTYLDQRLDAYRNMVYSEDSLKSAKADKALKKHAEDAGKKLSNMFKFCEDVFEEGQEMVILVTEFTISYYGARFISRYGCKEYFAHNKELLFYERQKEIIAELEALEL